MARYWDFDQIASRFKKNEVISAITENGEHVWLRPEMIYNRVIGVNICCFIGAPCTFHSYSEVPDCVRPGCLHLPLQVNKDEPKDIARHAAHAA